MKILYATDLDGSLLDANARLSSQSAEILNRLRADGALITYITARTPATAQPIMQASLPDIPAVVMTGAAIWNPQARKYEHVNYHTPDDMLTILDICRRHGVTPFVYTMHPGTNSLVVYHEAEHLTDIETTFVHDRTLNDLKTFHLYHKVPIAAADETVLFFAMGQPESIQAVADDIRAHTSCYASCYPDTYNPGIALLEVFTRGVSKAEGLRSLKALVGADKVVAFGDNLNDIPMLEAADIAVAVDNAHPEVKAHADIVIGPNTSDSVARFIDAQCIINSETLRDNTYEED